MPERLLSAAACAEIAARLEAAPGGPWELWTGCSWRRFGSAGTTRTVIEPTTHPVDGHPDLVLRDGVANLLTHLHEDIPALLRTVAALREALKPFVTFAPQMREDAECHRTWTTDEAQRDLQPGSAYLEKYSPRDIAGDAEWHKRWFDFYTNVAEAMERAAAVYAETGP